MATFSVPPEPAPRNGLTVREAQLLKSARAQLCAIIDGPLAPLGTTLYAEVMRLTGEIEKLLGY